MEVALAAASETRGLWTILLLGAVIAAGYVLSLFLHPFTRCGRCKGVPRHYGSVYTKSFRLCVKCGGNGRERRLGARMLGIDP